MSAATTGLMQAAENLTPEHYSDAYEPPVQPWRPPPAWVLVTTGGLLLAVGAFVWYKRTR